MKVPSSIKSYAAKAGNAQRDPFARRRAPFRGLEQPRPRTATPRSMPLSPDTLPRHRSVVRSWHWTRKHTPLIISVAYVGLIIVFWRRFLDGLAVTEGYMPPRSAMPIWPAAASTTSLITSLLFWVFGVGFTALALYLLATPNQQRLPAKALIAPLALGGLLGMCVGGILLQMLLGYR